MLGVSSLKSKKSFFLKSKNIMPSYTILAAAVCCVPVAAGSGCNLEASDDSMHCYLNRYADLKKAFGADLDAARCHFVTSGKGEGRILECPGSGLTLEEALIRDILPPPSAACTAGAKADGSKFSFTFKHKALPRGHWHDLNVSPGLRPCGSLQRLCFASAFLLAM